VLCVLAFYVISSLDYKKKRIVQYTSFQNEG